MTKSLKIALVILVLVVAFLAQGLYMHTWPFGNSGNTAQNNTPLSTEPVFDKPTSTSKSKVPDGFPNDIPVESYNIVNAYKVNYESQGLTQFTISYTSSKTKDELFDLYYNYMNTANFALTANTSRKLGQVVGTRAGSTLTINIVDGAATGGERVDMNYLYRKPQ